MKRSEYLARWAGAGLGVIGGFLLGYFIVRGLGGSAHPGWAIIGLTTLEGLIFAYLSTPYVLGGWRNFNFRLTSTPLPDLLSGLLGMIVGLVIAVLIGFFVRDLPYGYDLSAVLALLLAAQGASVGLTRRAELTSLFFGGNAEVDSHRMPAVLLDTSVIIDGRILDIAKTGFLDMPLIILSSVLHELQMVADSGDVTRRRRGRRGLDVLTDMQKEPSINLQVTEDETPPTGEIDAHLVRTAKRKGWAIMTNDFNLNRIARLEGVAVLNLNELAQAMRPIAIPGEEIVVTVAREGKEPGQGVGSLDDGTMVVVQNGRRLLNQTITAVVTSVIQTSAGRMIFAEPAGGEVRRQPNRVKPREESA
ncbi:MAG: PIN domain nuclease [Chloroflexi bacterium]|nr:MAG: PIN domain nuclease [Chloroflexota bacterium]TME03018.1 MAG: PIN domain nuclease [Chloroflexota bacterium]TME41462.1 MAG: PIN domain nuclease [Chloroflexota bacterium]TME52756.1 MAG: PIN domain nuclease [Chloroflexota bacterium]